MCVLDQTDCYDADRDLSATTQSLVQFYYSGIFWRRHKYATVTTDRTISRLLNLAYSLLYAANCIRLMLIDNGIVSVVLRSEQFYCVVFRQPDEQLSR